MRGLSCTLILDFMYFSEIRAFVQNEIDCATAFR